MSKKNAHKKKAGRKSSSPTRVPQSIREAAETRTAVAATVGWMLALMSTLTAEVIGLICRWYTIVSGPVPLLTVISMVMLFVACTSGVLTVAFIPVVLRVAKTRPPNTIIHVALVAGILPMLVVLVQFLTGGA